MSLRERIRPHRRILILLLVIIMIAEAGVGIWYYQESREKATMEKLRLARICEIKSGVIDHPDTLVLDCSHIVLNPGQHLLGMEEEG